MNGPLDENFGESFRECAQYCEKRSITLTMFSHGFKTPETEDREHYKVDKGHPKNFYQQTDSDSFRWLDHHSRARNSLEG